MRSNPSRWRGRPVGFLPATAVVRLDIADIQRLDAQGQLDEVVLHELGHALGIGTGWRSLGLVEDPVCGDSGCGSGDPRYLGAFANTAWHAMGGFDNIPVHNAGGPGSADSHWRESIFGPELMSPSISPADRETPLSAVTLGALRDLGYALRPGATGDAFSPSRTSDIRLPWARVIPLGEDLDDGPIFEVGSGGMRRLR